jgi:hypothetical protein
MRWGDVRYCFAMAILVIKFPNDVWELIVFAPFLFIIIIIPPPLLAAILSDQILRD